VAKNSRFRGPQLAELVESLDLGMHCLLVGPTATGKSLCAFEAFERTKVIGSQSSSLRGMSLSRSLTFLVAILPMVKEASAGMTVFWSGQ
jgi:hypothetical protein